MAMSEETADRLIQELPHRIQDCVSELEPDRMITRCLVMFESIDRDGSRTLTFLPGDEMRAWDVLGFMDYARAYFYTGKS